MEDIDIWQTKFQSCYYSDRLLNKLLKLNNDASKPVDITEIKKAIYYAKKYHGTQKRLSGEDFYSHPIEVAYMVSEYLFATDAIVTSILHDTIEDTKLTKKQIATIFGELIASQVEDLTRVTVAGKITSTEMIKNLWRQKNYDMLTIKICDRWHNLLTIDAKPQEKRRELLLETLKEFIVLAISLGMRKAELDLSRLCRGICQGNFVAQNNLPPVKQVFVDNDKPQLFFPIW
jgi:(p)ppGpp synthase/HD superfamily hydrolase